MLHWAVVFFILAVLAAILGFGGFVSGTLLWAAKIMFGLFLLLFIVFLVTGRNPYPPDPYV
jgi:uncharacterized membrane protein YtjA (UPF0391 family)